MTRPSSASFAQFFPAAAPRAARDKAMEREKEKLRKDASDPSASASPSTQSDRPFANGQATYRAPGRLDDHTVASSRRDISTSDPARTSADDTESLRADIPNTVSSDSSHTSIASSVTNASSTRASNPAVTKSSYSHVTPLTTIDSPSSSAGYHSTKPDTSSFSHSTTSRIDGVASRPNGRSESVAAMNVTDMSRRIPARDPSLRVQVIKAAHDPTIDRSSRDKKKPKYKEFGMVRKYTNWARQGGRHLHIIHCDDPG